MILELDIVSDDGFGLWPISMTSSREGGSSN